MKATHTHIHTKAQSVFICFKQSRLKLLGDAHLFTVEISGERRCLRSHSFKTCHYHVSNCHGPMLNAHKCGSYGACLKPLTLIQWTDSMSWFKELVLDAVKTLWITENILPGLQRLFDAQRHGRVDLVSSGLWPFPGMTVGRLPLASSRCLHGPWSCCLDRLIN